MKKALAALIALFTINFYASAKQITCIPNQQNSGSSFNTAVGEINCAPIKEKEFNYIASILVRITGFSC